MTARVAWTDPNADSKKAAEKDGKDEKSAGAQRVPSWREFTQNTTFHGVRYVFDDTTWVRK